MHLRTILATHTLVVLLLVRTAVAAEMVSVVGDDTGLRAGPGTGFEILWKLDAGFPLELISARGDWLQVRDFEGSRGWVRKNTTQKAAFVIVKANKGTKGQINVRKEPGQSADIVAHAGYGVVFKVLQRQDGWVKVAHDRGVTGWIDGRLLWGL
jgi:SH3-like domain-containing protein